MQVTCQYKSEELAVKTTARIYSLSKSSVVHLEKELPFVNEANLSSWIR